MVVWTLRKLEDHLHLQGSRWSSANVFWQCIQGLLPCTSGSPMAYCHIFNPSSFLFRDSTYYYLLSVYQIAAVRLLIEQLQCICVYRYAMVHDMGVILFNGFVSCDGYSRMVKLGIRFIWAHFTGTAGMCLTSQGQYWFTPMC